MSLYFIAKSENLSGRGWGTVCWQVGTAARECIDQSIRRLLHDKFRLGLFDSPYVDPDVVEQIVGNSSFRERGELAQRTSIVLLKNGGLAGAPFLPLSGGPKIYVENIAPDLARAYGQMEAVRKQKSDVPYYSENPLFPFGHGLTYAEVAGTDGSRTLTTVASEPDTTKEAAGLEGPCRLSEGLV